MSGCHILEEVVILHETFNELPREKTGGVFIDDGFRKCI
jgi:hypothetical protein